MAKSLKDQIEDAIKKEIAKIDKKVTVAVLSDLGQTVVNEMKKLIVKGNSPIEGDGKFPPYKAVGEAKSLSKAAKEAETKGARRELKTLAKERKAKGYPYSVQGRYPGKKVSPVNLTLSGDFLRKLTYDVKKMTGVSRVSVGFFDEDSIKKEQGHRFGVNGQPSRPIIPSRGQKLVAAIEKKILKKVRDIFK